MVESLLREHDVLLTMGGEPTYVPLQPEGPEWSYSAVGPTKLAYALALAECLRGSELPLCEIFFCPGKLYPGEANPRWALQLLSRLDGTPLFRKPDPAAERKRVQASQAEALRRHLLDSLVPGTGAFVQCADPRAPRRSVWVLPLDRVEGEWITCEWPIRLKRGKLPLLDTEGPAGLRLPLAKLPEDTLRRALTLELIDGRLHIFLPPLLQGDFIELLDILGAGFAQAGIGRIQLEGYIPPDELGAWTRLGLASDPGVLEVNLPPCLIWEEYDHWLCLLERCTSQVGLRSHKILLGGEELGTGGGNHILFGGPSLETNAFLARPDWLTGVARYWQQHPSLSYFFTGIYVGPGSQAPRADESMRPLLDLDLAYRTIEQLPPGDHRALIQSTLRHLHIDITGNTHRAEISLDKFWNTEGPAGCLGLIEFRAVETLPHASWMSATALLWRALFARILVKEIPRTLIPHGSSLHDRFLLPSFLRDDLQCIFKDLADAGIHLDTQPFQEIFEWRFPKLLTVDLDGESLEIRRALEPWPLLSEMPTAGGMTSRFVDSSIERLECSASPGFDRRWMLVVQGRELPLAMFREGVVGRGLRYRRTNLYPSLHPALANHDPLTLIVVSRESGKPVRAFHLTSPARAFSENDSLPESCTPTSQCGALFPDALTCDLRLD